MAPRLASALAPAAPAVLTFDASYESAINQFLGDVAAASKSTDNVYSVATQYFDNSGPIQYQSTFGGSYVTRDPLPKSGCNDGSDAYCLTDLQLEAEIQKVLTAKGWHGGLSHMFFIITPNGVGSCLGSSGINCSTNAFCAYHRYFTDSAHEDVLYANEPYEGPSVVPIGACTAATQGFPNDPDADTTISTMSHEHNEAITDPLTNRKNDAWVAADGNEIGDLCAFGFGSALGGTPGVNAWNQLINGHKYDLQEEWSNAADGGAGGCVQKLGGPTSPQPPGDGTGPLVYNGGPVMHTNTTYAIYWLPTARNTALPAVTGKAAVSHTLTSSAGSWAGGATAESYQWQRCSTTGTGCVDISGATAAKYKLTPADAGHIVRSTVRATNVNGASPAAASAATARVVDVPAVTKAPHISGRTRAGKKLSGSHGSWTNSPTYRYQWLRCNARGGSCSVIHAATHTTYTLTRRDAGHRLRIRVTARNAAGRETALSSATGRVR